MAELHPDIEEILLDEQDIKDIVKKVGAEITRDYADKNPLVIAVLRGAVVFMADIMRAIECPLSIDFMAVSSYGDGVKSSGVVRIVKDLDTKIEGRHVIIVEDVLDSGLTLSYLVRMLQSRNPASIEIAAFLVKDIEGKRPAVDPRYVGTHVPDKFVVGYGLDYAERYRNLPFVGVLKPCVYE
ncbi:MAG: hypoxanthine phosphoribosyltransferase [Atopobium sp.]|jgi:hypoxanthine phosphoribosyltransferase|uniref:hypoxanthine phosphoribosyltransferase n=1 Tax=Lancefieldella parvula TaxID=1382 RepID=UPI001CACE143|nr:hypoxanthine phosphoribosyltransferase [Lancefieldella parvula]MBF0903137.1 hypoxanthine phosphoribosyltransferase [Atopobium sp.]MBF0918327.1 hypoxanthine phosphoribosyltransferase [Atopobium sp.]MBF0922177.1 hypoxanthine phosphoribosyltransferase [Atopobium sp.]